MKKLNPGNLLFKQLANNPPHWWKILVADKDIYIDVRKENYIDIYYHGGSIIRELKFKGSKYSGKIHYKYILPQHSEYIDFTLKDNSIDLVKKQVELLSLNNLDKIALKRIKDNISLYYPSSSEKGIQAKFITNTGYFLDSEFAYNYSGIKLRFDLVWIDTINKRIVLVELKTIGDKRLYTQEIADQLKKYNEFAINYKQAITDYYKSVFEIKKLLDLLPTGLKKVQSLDAYILETKPLLLLGDCEQVWINNNAKTINARIKDVAVGAYYFGAPKYGCDLLARTSRNRYIL